MSAWAIVAGAGEGRRFGGPKAFTPLAGIPMVAHSLRALSSVEEVRAIVLVVPADLVERAPGMLGSVQPAVPVTCVAGGESRQSSIRAGLALVPGDVDRIVVHDAARPLLGTGLVAAVLAALNDVPGAVAAVPESDTLKRVEDDRVVETISRDGLWRAQTPQAFRASVLRLAHQRAVEDGFEATDDAVLLERIGEPVAIVPGDEANLKVTTPDDVALAEALFGSRASRA